MSRLRSVLDDPIVNDSSGYRLEIKADAVDAGRFEQLAEVGRWHLTAGNPAAAVKSFRDALSCWRGEPFGDLGDEPALRAEAARLTNVRLSAVCDRVEADLLLGRHGDVVDEVDVLCREHPYDERLRSLHMRALYGSGRQRDALLVYTRTRETLMEELGLEPSAILRQLELRILSHDPSLEPANLPRLQIAEGPASIRGFELRDEICRVDGVRWVRAYQRVPGREAVLRICAPDVANKPSVVADFERTARAITEVEHPHLLPLDDYWRDPNGAVATWRLLRGGRLGEILTSEDGRRHASAARIPDPDALIEQVGAALDSLDRRGIAHGDVCADSIQLDLEGHAFLCPPMFGDDRERLMSEDRVALEALASALRSSLPLDPELPAEENESLPEPIVATSQLDRSLQDLLHGPAEPGLGLGVVTQNVDGVRNPYKGLRAFDESDASDFFGRSDLTARLVESVRGNRLVAVIGPSGIGKSSVVRAGLLPAVRDGALGPGPWLITDMHPGRSPYDELASALLRVAVVMPRDLHAELTAGEDGLWQTCDMVLPAGHSLLLVIDQFEEVFSMVDDRDRLQFVRSLAAAARDERSRVRIALTMRADYFDHPLEMHDFGELVRVGLVPVAFPSDDELIQAVTNPARAAGLELQDGLTMAILNDVRDQPGTLPLLQHALTELVDRREGRRLTVAAYRASGGVIGALGSRAEELYLSLDDRGRDAAEQLFLRLVTVSDAQRGPVTGPVLGSGVDGKRLHGGGHQHRRRRRPPVRRAPTAHVQSRPRDARSDRRGGSRSPVHGVAASCHVDSRSSRGPATAATAVAVRGRMGRGRRSRFLPADGRSPEADADVGAHQRAALNGRRTRFPADERRTRDR